MKETKFNGYTVCLIESIEEIQSLKSLFSPKVMCGVDTETKSLEYKEDQVVGVCLSGGSDYTVQGYRGYYLPIRHVSYNNLPIKEVMEITQWVIDTHQTVFHNRNFDASMLEFDGIKIPFVGGMHDSQIMCYLTFNEPYPALKDYCTRFLKWDMIEFSENNAEDHNFGCFSADTKFLTRSGFKLFDDISEGEEIAQYNPDTKKLEFVTPTNRFDYFANNLYRIHSGRVDSIITDNHRVYSRAREEYKVTPASCVFGKQRTLQLGTKGFDGSYEIRTYFEAPTVLVKRQGKEWSRTYGRDIQFQKESLLKYLGFYLGDGTCPKYSSGYGIFAIFQSKSEVKEETVEWLMSVEVGDFVHYSETDRMFYWKIHQRTFCDWVWSNFVVDGIKRVPRWVYAMPIEDRKILLDAFVRADGHYRKDRKSYWIDVLSSKELAEDILELCISVGLSAKMSVYSVDLSRVPVSRGREFHLRKDKHYRIHVHPNKETKLSVDNWSLAKPQRVVCFSVPSTLLIVQRNYKTYISGNSTDPTVSFKYAAGDPVATVMLARKMWNDYPYIRAIYKIDNYTLEAVRLLCKNELTLDYDFLENLKDVTERKLKEIQTRIYSMSGVYGFNIDSAKDKADVLCYSEDTEFLTKSGFKKYCDIKDGEEVAQYCSGNIQFVKPLARTSRDSSVLYEFENSHVSFSVSDNHRMYVKDRSSDKYTIKPIEELYGGNTFFKVLNAATFEGAELDTPFFFDRGTTNSKTVRFDPDPFIQFLGFWFGDGYCTVNGTTHRVGISQSDCKKKEDTVGWVFSLMRRLGDQFTHREYKHFQHINRNHQWTLCHKEFAYWIDKTCKRDGKKRIPNWIFNLSVRQRRLFIEGFIKADGHLRGKTEKVLYAADAELIEQLYCLCVLSGYKVTRITSSKEGSTTSVRGVPLKSISKPCYSFTLLERTNETTVKTKEIIKREGKFRVNCFTVPSELLVVRRNGRTFVCGNSRFVTLTEKTKSGKFKTDEEALKRLNHPIATLMIEYAQTRVFLKSFVAKMCSYKGRTVRANYNTVNVPSGRLSSGGSSGNPYFIPQNLQNCLVGTTRVLTPKGIVQLNSLKVGDFVWDGDSFRKVLNFTSKGVKPVLRLRLSDGKSITGTSDHPILTENGFVLLSSCFGLRVALNSKRVEFESKSHKISFRVGRGITNTNKEFRSLDYSDPRVWGLLGYYIGDGSTSRCKIHFVFDWKAESLADSVLALCKDLNIPAKKNISKEKEGVRDIFKVTIYNADLWRHLFKFGLAVNSHRKRVPEVLYTLPESCRMAFLQGLYAADGCSEKYSTSPHIKTVSGRLAFGVSKLCESLGINVKVTKHPNKSIGCGYAYCVSILNRFNCFDVFRFLSQTKWLPTFHNQGLEKYCLPKRLGGKKQRYLVRESEDFERSKFWVKCESIESVGFREVFDIEVEDSHIFCANGIIVHNCPKEEEKLYLHRHPVIGYSLEREEKGCVRDKDGNPIKIKTKTGLHRAFIPHDKDWFIMTSDYSSQEMRLAANFSREPNLVEPLLEGKDIHNYVAKSMFGFEDPDHRTKVKVLNFACLYGAEGPTIANRLGVSVEEGKALFAKYKATMSKLFAWKAEVIKAAKRRGYSLTYFGRPIYLLKFLSSSDRKNVAYAERLALNSVVQGCLPSMTFVPSQDGKTFKTFHALIAERIKFAKDEKGLERLGVPTYRGKDRCEFVVFDSGDFLIASWNHKFLEYKSETNLLSISQAFDKPVEMMKPAKKCKLWQSILKTILCSNDYFHLTTLQVRSVRDEAPAYDSKVAYSLFRAWLFQETIKTNNQWSMHTMRSLVDLYGYNLVIVEPGKYKLSWSRRKKAKVIYTIPCGVDNVVSPSMISGYQTYPLSGFIHKNTGADLMRLFLIKFTMLNKNNEEWRNNTRLILPVHDEQNLEVHKDYLYKAWKYMKKVMNFKPDNFVIPIVVDSGVGTSWGNCLDFECVSPKNRIVPKDLDPDRLPDDERQYLIDIIKECNEEDLPDKLKKFR